MVNISSALARKQNAIAKNAQAALIRARSVANLNNARAEQLGSGAPADPSQQGLQQGPQSAQPVDLSSLQKLIGNRLGGGGGLPGGNARQPPLVPGAGGLGVGQSGGAGQQSLTTPPTGGPQQQRQTTSTAPSGFGLSTDSESRRGRDRVFGSLFNDTRGL